MLSLRPEASLASVKLRVRGLSMTRLLRHGRTAVSGFEDAQHLGAGNEPAAIVGAMGVAETALAAPAAGSEGVAA